MGRGALHNSMNYSTPSTYVLKSQFKRGKFLVAPYIPGATLGIHDHGCQIHIIKWILSKSTGAKPIDFQIHGCQAPVAPALTPPLPIIHGLFSNLFHMGMAYDKPSQAYILKKFRKLLFISISWQSGQHAGLWIKRLAVRIRSRYVFFNQEISAFL